MRHSTQLKEILEREIVTGEIKPGERLEELEIANRFGVSRTPVREALAMLEAINLVKRKPRQGTVVIGITLERIVQMVEVLTHLEVFCAELATRRLNSKNRKLLTGHFKNLEAAAGAKDADLYYDQVIEYHRAIFDATGNDILVETTESVAERLEPFLRAEIHQSGGIRRSLEDSRKLNTAILSGKVNEATDAMNDVFHMDTKIFIEFATGSH